jgi:hypothetical protein
MRTEAYLASVSSVYQGEVYGEALFSGLLASTDVPGRALQFATMLQMESEAKAMLRPLLARLGISVVEQADARRRGDEDASRLARLPWSEFLEQFEREILEYVERYRLIAEQAPAEDQEALWFMVEHERILCRFAVAEREGRSDDALAELNGSLRFPLGDAATQHVVGKSMR